MHFGFGIIVLYCTLLQRMGSSRVALWWEGWDYLLVPYSLCPFSGLLARQDKTPPHHIQPMMADVSRLSGRTPVSTNHVPTIISASPFSRVSTTVHTYIHTRKSASSHKSHRFFFHCAVRKRRKLNKQELHAHAHARAGEPRPDSQRLHYCSLLYHGYHQYHQYHQYHHY
jgi:hypothetical protein